MSTPVIVFPALRASRAGDAVEASERWVHRRVALAWGLLFVNVLTFYSQTWTGQPTVLPIPSAVGKLITQGALAAALVLALSANRRLVIRPNVFLCLLSLLVIAALMTSLHPLGHFSGTLFRASRLAGFVATLWLLTPWWGRRDLLLVKCHLAAISAVLGTVVLGALVAPSEALSQGRLQGVLWEIPPTQVAHFAAVTAGIVSLLWLSGQIRGRVALVALVAAGAVLLLTHTRTALVAMLVGLLIGGLSLFTTNARVRKLFVAAAVLVPIGAVALSGVATTWLARGEDAQQLTELTGRTLVWSAIVNAPRDHFQVIFGYGLSNKSFNGLPIDSNWLAAYFDLGLVGVGLCVLFLLFVLVRAYFFPRGYARAIALFLVTYCLIASFTETGLSDASMYLLDLTLAASLLVPSVVSRRQIS